MLTSVLSPSIASFTEMATTLTEIHQAHAHMLKTGFIHNPFAAGRLISFSTNPTSIFDPRIITYADSVFSRIKNPNSFHWNTMIRAYANSSTPEKSLFIFHEMLHTPIYPDQYSFTFVLKACSSLRCIEEGQQIHGLIHKSGFGSDVFIQNTLIHLYSVVGYFEKARVLLDRMLERNVISWNAILSAYVEQGLMGPALELFEEMSERNVESWNFMISGYVGIGLVDEARGIFDDMLSRDLVSWNAMITGYAQSGQFYEVLKLFKEMQLAKVKPDNCTLVNVLSACAKVGGLSQGEWIHAYIDKSGIKIVGFLATALIDMYSKCGCIDKALRVFNDTTTRKDISTWNSMVAGLSLHGYGKQAVKLFFDMMEDGYKPNEITFISVLSACSRSGLLDDGRKIFELMVRVHGIKPTIEHYGCIVDLYARAGLLEEAEEFIETIPSKEVESVLESLLSACTSHGNVEMAERLAKKILDMNPSDSSSSYVQLSNVYAMKGRWEDVREVRRMMRLEKVRKEPGCSLIEIDGVVHEFLAGDGLHCEDEIIGNS